MGASLMERQPRLNPPRLNARPLRTAAADNALDGEVARLAYREIMHYLDGGRVSVTAGLLAVRMVESEIEDRAREGLLSWEDG